MTAFIATLCALAILATASKATPRKWVALLALCVLLLASCSAGGADSYYNDTPRAARPTAKTVPLPTTVVTLPPQPPKAPSKASMTGGSVMAGDDYAASAGIALGLFCLSPLAIFLFTYAIGGPIMRRYGFIPIRGTPNE